MPFINPENKSYDHLEALLNNLSIDEPRIRSKAQYNIKVIFKHDKQFDPDTIARVALFLAKKKISGVKKEDIKKIEDNGGNYNRSWINLLPTIKNIV